MKTFEKQKNKYYLELAKYKDDLKKLANDEKNKHLLKMIDSNIEPNKPFNK